MSEPQLKKRIIIPKDFTEEQRQSLAIEIIDYIKLRTENNKDIDGKKFHKYSESYVNSKDFKAAGKSANDVNLRLSDEMMESIEVLEQGPGYITIGYQEGTFANDKAVYNQRSDNGPSRMFLGINHKDLDRLIAKVTVDTLELKEASASLANKILKKFGL